MATHFHPFPRSPLHRPLPPFPRYLTFRHSLELVEMLRFRSRCYLFRAGRASKNPHRSRFSADSHPRENLSAGYRIPSPPSDPFEGPVIDYYSPTISHELLFRVPIRNSSSTDFGRIRNRAQSAREKRIPSSHSFCILSASIAATEFRWNCRTVSREKKDKVRRRKRSRYFPLQRDGATSKKCFPSTDRHDFPRHHRAIIRLFVMLRITRRKGKRRIERARGAVFRRTTRTAGTLVNTLLGNAVLVYVGTHLVFLSRARTSSPMCADAPKTAYYLLSLSLFRSLLPSLTTPESRSFQTDVAL